MSIQYNGQNIKEMYYNGQKISEAYYNGEKVFSGENVLFEDDIYLAADYQFYTLPETYPAGSIIEWSPIKHNVMAEKSLVRISGGSAQASQRLSTAGVAETQTEYVSNIDFNTLSYFTLMSSTPAMTFHIKIIGA